MMYEQDRSISEILRSLHCHELFQIFCRQWIWGIRRLDGSDAIDGNGHMLVFGLFSSHSFTFALEPVFSTIWLKRNWIVTCWTWRNKSHQTIRYSTEEIPPDKLTVGVRFLDNFHIGSPGRRPECSKYWGRCAKVATNRNTMGRRGQFQSFFELVKPLRQVGYEELVQRCRLSLFIWDVVSHLFVSILDVTHVVINHVNLRGFQVINDHKSIFLGDKALDGLTLTNDNSVK